ncbi:hypothetical protein [Microbacterium jejuense]|uniref:hypothetical protein n=1 Tax=Microbacterium jejuense TaxID=1263637 RepID=UPI0031EF3072
MLDARLPAEWLGSIRIDNLSDRAFRVLVSALMWCSSQGTDGSVPTRYTKYLHPEGDDPAAFDELERAGLWKRVDDGYRLVGWTSTLRQSTAEEVERYREGARRRQKEYRDRQRAAIADHPGPRVMHRQAISDGTPDSTRDMTANVGPGSSDQSKSGANATREKTAHVTHNADSPFCTKHPTGTPKPCSACARARAVLEARQGRLTIPGWDCTVDGHKPSTDGTCAVCANRPGRSVA